MSLARDIIRFYDPTIRAADLQGRTLSTILAWSDDKLEDCHDYIQNLFPLPEPSIFNPDAPVISSGVFTAFRTRPELRNRLKESFRRMLKFYGLKLHEDGAKETVLKGENFGIASKNWVTHFNHNHLRITRIIRCIRVLGLERQAQAFFIALQKGFKGGGWGVGERTQLFWTRAATRPLYLAPDHSDEEKARFDKAFLWEFEEYRRLRGGEQRDGYESGVIAPETAIVAAGNKLNPPILKNGQKDGEGSEKTNGTVAKASEARSSSEYDSDAPAFSTRSYTKKRKRTTSNIPL
ncbi:hypothetical protein MMC07_009397 [Pseudocyphellaria aurata]|nr:hypothetical protein [Pseudocyphellaria aurata]